LILTFFLGLTPKAFAEGPDYSDQNLPLLKGLKLDVVLDNANQITFKLRVTVETKNNELSRIDYLQFLPEPNPLEPPCGFTSAKAWKISWVLQGSEIKSTGTQEYVLERSFQMQKICSGRYALSDVNLQYPSIRLTDSANHWVEYSTSDYAPRQYKSSNVWKSPSAIQPKCEHNVTSTEYVRYLLCDENIDLINMIQKNVVNISKEQISNIEAKAAAELKAKQEAEAKAAAELKAKQEAEAKAAKDAADKLESEFLIAKETVLSSRKSSLIWAESIKSKYPSRRAEIETYMTKVRKYPEPTNLNMIQVLEREISVMRSKIEYSVKIWESTAKKVPSTIICVKGKISKQVTSVKPVCPKGFNMK
jgi:hypothetical protein